MFICFSSSDPLARPESIALRWGRGTIRETLVPQSKLALPWLPFDAVGPVLEPGAKRGRLADVDVCVNFPGRDIYNHYCWTISCARSGVGVSESSEWLVRVCEDGVPMILQPKSLRS